MIGTLKNKVSNKLHGVVHVPATREKTGGQSTKKGRVLLSYLTGPFTLLPWQRFTDPHTNYWECSEIARLFSVRGYDVDVINASNTSFVPRKQYDAVVDVRQNLERWCTAGLAGTSLLPASCKKVMHITSSESGFQNAAEAKRLAELKQRRGIILPAHASRPVLKILLMQTSLKASATTLFTQHLLDSINRFATFLYPSHRHLKLPRLARRAEKILPKRESTFSSSAAVGLS